MADSKTNAAVTAVLASEEASDRFGPFGEAEGEDECEC
jgi:hypothetical protein